MERTDRFHWCPKESLTVANWNERYNEMLKHLEVNEDLPHLADTSWEEAIDDWIDHAARKLRCLEFTASIFKRLLCTHTAGRLAKAAASIEVDDSTCSIEMFCDHVIRTVSTPGLLVFVLAQELIKGRQCKTVDESYTWFHARNTKLVRSANRHNLGSVQLSDYLLRAAAIRSLPERIREKVLQRDPQNLDEIFTIAADIQLDYIDETSDEDKHAEDSEEVTEKSEDEISEQSDTDEEEASSGPPTAPFYVEEADSDSDAESVSGSHSVEHPDIVKENSLESERSHEGICPLDERSEPRSQCEDPVISIEDSHDTSSQVVKEREQLMFKLGKEDGPEVVEDVKEEKIFCMRCLGKDHLPSECKCRKYRCRNCKKYGHIKIACLDKKI